MCNFLDEKFLKGFLNRVEGKVLRYNPFFAIAQKPIGEDTIVSEFVDTAIEYENILPCLLNREVRLQQGSLWVDLAAKENNIYVFASEFKLLWNGDGYAGRFGRCFKDLMTLYLFRMQNNIPVGRSALFIIWDNAYEQNYNKNGGLYHNLFNGDGPFQFCFNNYGYDITFYNECRVVANQMPVDDNVINYNVIHLAAHNNRLHLRILYF